ncbi:MAG: pilus assembly protein PilM, partial [Dehalococcoidia bacterium]
AMKAPPPEENAEAPMDPGTTDAVKAPPPEENAEAPLDPGTTDAMKAPPPEEDAEAPLDPGTTDAMKVAPPEEDAEAPIDSGTTDAMKAPPPEENAEVSSLEPQSPPRSAAPQRAFLRRPRGPADHIRGILRRRKVTLSLENDVMRVVVIERGEVVAWGTAAQAEKPVAENNDADLEGEGQADRLRNLLKHLGIFGGRVVTDLPLHAPLMRHLQLPKIGRRYLEEVVASEVLETIPFSAEEVDLTWQVRSNGTDQEVLAVAVQKEVMDDHVRLLSEAGIRPRAAYSKAVALAHVAGVTDGIVVHLESSQVALVLVHQGVPQVAYQVEFAENETSPQEQAEAVSKAVEVVSGYYQNIDSGDASQRLPVVLTGQLSSEGPLAQALQQALQREVQPFTPPLVCPENFPPGEYAVNLGLALADQARTKARGKVSVHGMPSVNLLPERYLPRPLPIMAVAVFVALLLLGTVAFNITPQVDSVSNEAVVLSASLTEVQRQQRQQRLLLASTRAIEEDTQAAQQLSQGLVSNLAGLDGDLEVLLEQLETLTSTALPPNVRLSTLKQIGEGYALTGTASTYEDTLQYTANLRTSDPFGAVWIKQAAGNADGGTISFQVTAGVAFPQETESDAQPQ